MMTPEQCFDMLCRSADPAGALDRLGDAALAGLIRQIEASGITGGIPGVVLGLAEREAVKRWCGAHAGNFSPVGEG